MEKQEQEQETYIECRDRTNCDEQVCSGCGHCLLHCLCDPDQEVQGG